MVHKKHPYLQFAIGITIVTLFFGGVFLSRMVRNWISPPAPVEIQDQK